MSETLTLDALIWRCEVVETEERNADNEVTADLLDDVLAALRRLRAVETLPEKWRKRAAKIPVTGHYIDMQAVRDETRNLVPCADALDRALGREAKL